MSYLSLVMSAVALVYAIWSHQKAEQMANEALRKRETQFVANFAPKFQAMFAASGNVYPTEPKTMEELLQPLVDVVNGMSASAEDVPVPSR